MRHCAVWALAALVAAGGASAEPNDIASWLMNEPVTLWDRGMDRADKKAREFAAFYRESIGSSSGIGFATYDWDENEIELIAIISEYGEVAQPTHADCNLVRDTFIVSLNGRSSRKEDDEAEIQSRYETISSWFSHVDFQRMDRDEDLGEKMARMIFVSVLLTGSEGSILCRDRITSFDAPSRPRNFEGD